MSRGHVIGLASLPGAGKGKLADHLVSLGVEYLHVGTLVRETAAESGFEPAEETREAYLPFWEQYSKTHGQNWLARIALQKAAESDRQFVLDGVRIPADAETISQVTNGTMTWLASDLRSAGRRVLSRGRIEDAGISDVDDYVAKMQRDLTGNGNFAMGLVRDASEVFLLPVPELNDRVARSNYFNCLARYLLDACGLTSETSKQRQTTLV